MPTPSELYSLARLEAFNEHLRYEYDHLTTALGGFTDHTSPEYLGMLDEREVVLEAMIHVNRESNEVFIRAYALDY